MVTDNYTYNAWGKLLQQTGTSTNPFQWIGELGYHYDGQLDRHLLRRRQYQADMARFLSEDPLGFSAGDENLYRYVANNPVNAVDPSGLGNFPCNIPIAPSTCPGPEAFDELTLSFSAGSIALEYYVSSKYRLRGTTKGLGLKTLLWISSKL